MNGHGQLIERVLNIEDMHIERTVTGRSVYARALTYGRPYRVTDDGRTYYREIWRAGVFDRSVSQRGPNNKIPVRVIHQPHRTQGAVVELSGGKTDLIFRAKIYDGPEGDVLLEQLDDGVLNGVSVGASIINYREIDGGVERVEAALNEISLAPPDMAQMPDGRVLALRAMPWEDDDEPPATTAIVTPTLDEARRVLASIQRP